MSKCLLYSLICFIISFALFSYKLDSSYIFETDFGRDMNDIIQIGQGKPTLIGTKSSLGGIYQGPWYYYLFLPAFWLSGFNPFVLLYFNTFFFALILSLFYYHLLQKTKPLSATLITLSIALSQTYLLPARNPGNAFSYIPLLLLFLYSLNFNNYQNNKPLIILLGLLSGFIINFHYATFLIILPLTIHLFFSLKQRSLITLFLLSISATFFPLILFELKHNFIMFKNTFVEGSYKSFTDNTIIPQNVPLKRNFIENLSVYSVEIGKWLPISPLILTIVTLITRPRSRFYFYCLSSFPLLSLVLTSQIAPHYFLPFSLTILVPSLLLIGKTKLAPIIGLLIILEIFTFPKFLYTQSSRSFARFETAVNTAIKKNLIDNTRSFNILQYRDKSLINPLGFEYRFYLRKSGFKPKSEFEFANSDTLYLFSEDENLDPKNLASWEIDQFGKENLSPFIATKLDGITLFKFTKSH